MSSPASTIRASTRRAAPPRRPSSGSAKPRSIWRPWLPASSVSSRPSPAPCRRSSTIWQKYGLSSRCARVRASDVAVLDLELPGSDARGKISAEISRAISDDKAEAIVLGCAGMADLADELSREHGVPVLDGVACAVRLAETVSALGLRTSKVGGYAWPRAKRFAGIYVPRRRVAEVTHICAGRVPLRKYEQCIGGIDRETRPYETPLGRKIRQTCYKR